MTNIPFYLKQALGSTGLILPVLTSSSAFEKLLSFGFIIVVLILIHQLKTKRIKNVAEAVANIRQQGKLKSFSFENGKIDVQFFEEKIKPKKGGRKKLPRS